MGEWQSTQDKLSLPLKGPLRVSALDMATDTAMDIGCTAMGRGLLRLGQQLLLRTTTTSTATSLPPSMPSANPMASDTLTSRYLACTPASTMVATMASDPLSPSMGEWQSTQDKLSLPLKGPLRVSALDMATVTGFTAMARGPLMPTTELLPLPTLSIRRTRAMLQDLTSRSRASTPGLATATELATSTKD